jgi:phosphoribosylaminoimidazole-succinocarboxamide synthase
MSKVVLSIDIPGVPKFISGKVREVFDLGDALLLVATDRLSAFDVVLPTGIPDKGRVLTQFSVFWFKQTENIVPNHLISADSDVIGQRLRDAGAEVTPELMESLAGRSLLCTKCQAFPVECVVRGYLAGSAWKDYKKLFAHGGEVRLYDIPIPVGLRESEKLERPLFTPATKATTGHDENISASQAGDIVGQDTIAELAEKSIAVYSAARDYAAERGIIIADTKFEFGRLGDKIILIDEALTPDSSRFWDAASFAPGKSQPSFDKQFVRDYLETLDWNKEYPGPELPAEIAEQTAQKYRDAYKLITGTELPR